jgi:hypothetical protein
VRCPDQEKFRLLSIHNLVSSSIKNLALSSIKKYVIVTKSML